MPEAWNSKDERQYKEIRKSAIDRGRTEDRAEEIAARTVNKRRRSEGRTQNTASQGTGNPNSSLDERTIEELRNRASELNIRGRSSMKKEELVEAIRSAS
jgi:hypothetical protein